MSLRNYPDLAGGLGIYHDDPKQKHVSAMDMENFIKQLKPQSKNLALDAIAGFTTAIVSIPDSLDSAILAGVSPTSR